MRGRMPGRIGNRPALNPDWKDRVQMGKHQEVAGLAGLLTYQMTPKQRKKLLGGQPGEAGSARHEIRPLTRPPARPLIRRAVDTAMNC